jgi:hypothetical protein
MDVSGNTAKLIHDVNGASTPLSEQPRTGVARTTRQPFVTVAARNGSKAVANWFFVHVE